MSAASIRVERLSDRQRGLSSLASLRMTVFAQWPYLYDGDAGYEELYLREFLGSEGATLIWARAGDTVIGMATASPLIDQSDAIKAPIAAAGIDVARSFYFGESALLSEYRGLSLGHQFFELRERAAIEAGAEHALFCAVGRDDDDARKPKDARDLRPFWQGRGYEPLEGAQTLMSWKEHNADRETDHVMHFWHKRLIRAPA